MSAYDPVAVLKKPLVFPKSAKYPSAVSQPAVVSLWSAARPGFVLDCADPVVACKSTTIKAAGGGKKLPAWLFIDLFSSNLYESHRCSAPALEDVKSRNSLDAG
jgi:hypothetical protein